MLISVHLRMESTSTDRIRRKPDLSEFKRQKPTGSVGRRAFQPAGSWDFPVPRTTEGGIKRRRFSAARAPQPTASGTRRYNATEPQPARILAMGISLGLGHLTLDISVIQTTSSRPDKTHPHHGSQITQHASFFRCQRTVPPKSHHLPRTFSGFPPINRPPRIPVRAYQRPRNLILPFHIATHFRFFFAEPFF